MVDKFLVVDKSPHQKRLGENRTTKLGGTQNKSGTLFITKIGYEKGNRLRKEQIYTTQKGGK